MSKAVLIAGTIAVATHTPCLAELWNLITIAIALHSTWAFWHDSHNWFDTQL